MINPILNRIIWSDCIEHLKKIPDESIDMILVDPPYFSISKEDWDNQWKSEDEYLEWCRTWTEEAIRVLREGGVFAVWGTTKTNTFLRYKLDILDEDKSPLQYINWIIWSYDWGGKTKKTFARKHEDLLVYSKGTNFTFNIDAIRIPYKMKKNCRAGANNNPLGKIPTDVWEHNNHTCSKEYVKWHSTQKPFKLLKRLIQAYTNEGDIILDFFSGSGSTAISASQTGRNFIACDFNDLYVELSKQRKKEMENI